MGKSTSVTSEKFRNYIPDDLAFCILSKLPLKSLKRFGCIHKSWALLFENHHFMCVFRNNFISNHHAYYDDTTLLLRTEMNDFYSFSGDSIENMEKLNWKYPIREELYYWVLDSGTITGIICFYLLDGRVVLWNPAIEEYKIIPISPLTVLPYYDIDAKAHGFGYDEVSNDYKLLRSITYFPFDYDDCDYYGISYSKMPKHLTDYIRWEIYSLRSNSWRRLDLDVSTFPVTSSSIASQRLYMNGICHWWHLSETHNGADLASFNLGNEVLVKTPILLDMHSWRIHLAELNGSIALISWIFGTTSFNISILCEVGVKESWTKLFTIEPPLLSCYSYPVGVGKKGEIFFRNLEDEIVFSSLSNQKVQKLGVELEILIYKKNILQLEE